MTFSVFKVSTFSCLASNLSVNKNKEAENKRKFLIQKIFSFFLILDLKLTVFFIFNFICSNSKNESLWSYSIPHTSVSGEVTQSVSFLKSDQTLEII